MEFRLLLRRHLYFEIGRCVIGFCLIRIVCHFVADALGSSPEGSDSLSLDCGTEPTEVIVSGNNVKSVSIHGSNLGAFLSLKCFRVRIAFHINYGPFVRCNICSVLTTRQNNLFVGLNCELKITNERSPEIQTSAYHSLWIVHPQPKVKNKIGQILCLYAHVPPTL